MDNRGGGHGLIAAYAKNPNVRFAEPNGISTHGAPSYQCTANGKSDDCVIAVAAITRSGGRASFANYGRTTVDIGAPGAGIYSSVPYNSYASYSGTLMATPHVSGAAALYASTHAGAGPAQIKNAILSSAIATASLANITVTGGHLDANAMNSR